MPLRRPPDCRAENRPRSIGRARGSRPSLPRRRCAPPWWGRARTSCLRACWQPLRRLSSRSTCRRLRVAPTARQPVDCPRAARGSARRGTDRSPGRPLSLRTGPRLRADMRVTRTSLSLTIENCVLCGLRHAIERRDLRICKGRLAAGEKPRRNGRMTRGDLAGNLEAGIIPGAGAEENLVSRDSPAGKNLRGAPQDLAPLRAAASAGSPQG